jgi:hypothetical protein
MQEGHIRPFSVRLFWGAEDKRKRKVARDV